ncbi:MAG: universal stress protein [Fimbriimonadaceae bacterium]|nr:universal stress protein [Alphaproteobacteria bacterium]
MTYRTILVHLGAPRHVAGTLGLAIELAKRNEAHLVGLHVTPVAQLYGGFEAQIPADIIAMQDERFQEIAGEIEKTFTKMTGKEGISAEWRCTKPKGKALSEEIVDHARRADLVIATQEDPEEESLAELGVAEQLMLGAGRPVLVVPYTGSYSSVGENIMIAWNASREAARATFDAMPFLKQAKRVEVLWANPAAANPDDMSIAGSEIAKSLSRHGIRVEAAHSINKQISIGDELLSRLADHSIDLLVMGGYGHSRFREYVLGGATRHILQHMTVPVLMSH